MASDDADKFVVPKFGSFKSREAQEKPKSRDGGHRSKPHEDRRKREHERRRDGRESKRRRREQSRSRSRSRGRRHDPPQRQPLQPELFTIDVRGDALIRRYGTLERSRVPAYHRHGHGRVLGTTGRLILYHDGPRDYFSLRMPGEGAPRYRDREGLRSKRPMAHSHPVTLKRRHVAAVDDESDGFLSLKSSKEKKHDTDSSDDEHEPSYRSIEGKAKAAHYDSEADSESAPEAQDLETSSPMKWKSVQLNRRVKEKPEDIDSWLELVEHQNELLRQSVAEGSARDSEAHSYSEIKVSMLEKALRNAKSAVDRERVLVPLMREGAKVWTGKVVARRWAEEMGAQATTNSHTLWRLRLESVLTSIADFDFSNVKQMFLDRLRHVVSTGGEDTRMLLEAVEVFLLATRFFYDGGHREIAAAAWQGMLEATFFRPDGDDAPDDLLPPPSFQDFWESEVPRIGEAGAAGWKQFVLSGGQGEAPETMPATSTETSLSRDIYKAWSQLESERASRAKLPARTMDEGTEDDPFRVVTSADIEPLLFMIPRSAVPAMAAPLMDAFLIFCGLAPASSSPWARALYGDQLLVPLASSIPSTSLGRDDEAAMDSSGDEAVVRRPPLFSRPHSSFAVAPEVLFSGAGWFRYLEPQLLDAAVDGEWLETTLGQLVAAGWKDVSVYYLAVAFARDESSVKKVARKLLKQSPDNVALYTAYALAEYVRGKRDVSFKVLDSAAASPLLAQQSDVLWLRQTKAWIAFMDGDLVLAKQTLCDGGDIKQAASEEGEMSVADVLKAGTLFANSRSKFLSMGDVESAEVAAKCVILFSYLTSGDATEPKSVTQGNISAGMQALDMVCSDLGAYGHAKTASHERLVQFGTQLLYLHATKGPHRRVYVREQMRKHLTIFPESVMLLSVLEWSDTGLRVVDETRELLSGGRFGDGTVRETLTRAVFAVQHELGRGNVHAARAAFETATKSDGCRSSVMVWTWYVCFAHRYRRQLWGEDDENKGSTTGASSIFYRALRHCPWAKAVPMEAFGTLVGVMGRDELRSVYDMMTGKGMRVHVELEEFTQGREVR